MPSIRLLFIHLYAWACQRLYHEFAWAYDAVAWLVSLGHWSRWRRLALDELPDDGGCVLELGFGTGALLAELAQSGRSVVGLDASPAMQQMAARRLAVLGVNAPRVQGVAQALPFPGQTFAAVISTFPAAYILAPETLSECRRVLHPDGRLVIGGLWVTPTNGLLRRLLPVFFGSPSSTLIASIRKMLIQAGFHDVKMEYGRSGWAQVAVVTASVNHHFVESPRRTA